MILYGYHAVFRSDVRFADKAGDLPRVVVCSEGNIVMQRYSERVMERKVAVLANSSNKRRSRVNLCPGSDFNIEES